MDIQMLEVIKFFVIIFINCFEGCFGVGIILVLVLFGKGEIKVFCQLSNGGICKNMGGWLGSYMVDMMMGNGDLQFVLECRWGFLFLLLVIYSCCDSRCDCEDMIYVFFFGNG